MKVESGIVMINVVNTATFGEFKMDQIAQLCIYLTKENKIDIDIDYIDDVNITYMDMPVENFRKLKDFHKENLGINLDKTFFEIFNKNFAKNENPTFEKLKEQAKPFLMGLSI